MKCPKEIRLCPEGWEDCSLCRYVSLAIGIDTKTGKRKHTCLYESKSDIDIVVLAAKIAEEVVTKEAIESAHKIRGTWMEELDQLPEGGIWEWMARYRTPNLHAVEPYKAMSGPTEPGGSTMKCKKDTKGHKPTVYVWEDT